jgi:glycosyltransferase involved in cell wall biosynthesis
MSPDHKLPLISVGLPVFNGEMHLESALDSILTQTCSDFELIISDNASSDRTEEICEHYANIDQRVRYIRQPENIGATNNFKFVLDQAIGKYFMWAAADDIRSSCFIEKNSDFLELHPEYVASTSKNYFEGEETKLNKHIHFSIEGCLYERLKTFIQNSRHSHGIFYSLIRLEKLKGCEAIGKRMIAADWVVDVHLLVAGPIKRINKGYMQSGRGGVSNSANPYKPFQNHFVEYLFPLYLFSKFTTNLVVKSIELSVIEKSALLFMLIKINLIFGFSRLISVLRTMPGYKILKKTRNVLMAKRQ